MRQERVASLAKTLRETKAIDLRVFVATVECKIIARFVCQSCCRFNILHGGNGARAGRVINGRFVQLNLPGALGLLINI